MLAVSDVSVAFGGFRALDGVALEARPGRITGLIGPNGSGKSTLLNVVSGILEPASGQILLNGRPLPAGRPDLVAIAGVGRTFQVPCLARRLSVMENLLVGARHHPGERLDAILFRPWRVRAAERAAEARAWALLDRLGLVDKLNEPAGNLSGGQQKLLSLGVLLMADPQLLLLDEPAAGVNPVLVAQQARFLDELRREGRIILLVEHNMELVASVCDEVVVLDAGRVIATGTPAEIRRHPEVLRSYLGALA